MTRIVLPHQWRARQYQSPVWRFLDNGGKRVALRWHRRSGKDNTLLHWTTVASQRRVGVYWHMLPTLRQGRKVIWENIGADGHRIMDAWPGWKTPGRPDGLVSHIRNDEMKVELHNGSIWYVVGSDNYDAVMGTNPVGVVFSEYALSDPKAWDFVRPILNENQGWAAFIWTPRGKNHASDLYRNAEKSEHWFAETLTVDDTCRDDGTPVITPEMIQMDRDEGVAEEHILQEYYCSEDAPMVGAYWGEQLIEAEREKRITGVPHDPATRVDTWWDIGYSDATAVWFVQHVGGEIHVIDYQEANGATPEDDVAMLRMLERPRDPKAAPITYGGRAVRPRGFVYGRHIWPHDGGAKTKASRGKPLSSIYSDLGVTVDVQPRNDVEVAIQRVRQILPRCWFDEEHTAMGLSALRAFRKDLDEDKSVWRGSTLVRPYFKPSYVHDWSSHGASAFYTGSMSHHSPNEGRIPRRDRYGGRSTSGPASPWAA